MSWTLLLFGGDDPPPAPEWPRDWQPPAMGSSSQVRDRISEGLPGVAWHSDGWGQYGAETCLLEFNLGAEDPVSCVAVNVCGPGAVQLLLKLAGSAEWYLVNASSMELMTPENQPRL
jgi:hypothetical protein